MLRPRFNHYFFTHRPALPSFAQIQIGRLAAYPASIVAGEAILATFGQGAVLAAVPPLMHLAFFAAVSACLLMPIFMGIQFLIDKYLAGFSRTQNASYVLLYLTDIFLNMKLMADLATMLTRPVMNVYTLYSIVGTGIFAVVALSIVVSLMIQAYGAYHAHGNDVAPPGEGMNADEQHHSRFACG